MALLVGTVGYSYADWKGNFYPEKCPQSKMLAYYAQRFSTVELHYTFRQLPNERTVEGWTKQVAESFRFVLKARQVITHFKRLHNVEKETDDFLNVAAILKERQGPILVQLPPNFKKDVLRLDAFLKHVAGRAKVAFEFRDASWFDDEVVDCLRAHSAVFCAADGGEFPTVDFVRTAVWGYVRLCSENYTAESIRKLLRSISAQKWTEDSYCVGNVLADPTQAALFLSELKAAGQLVGAKH